MASSPPTPSVLAIVLEYTFPLRLIIELFFRGLLPTLHYMLFHPLCIPFPSAWQKQFLKAGQPALLDQADKTYAEVKRKIISQAKGRVLEIGAGTGETVKYYERGNIDVIYGVEPNVDALEGLKKRVIKHDLVDKYEILPFGVEEREKMREAGVQNGSIDTVIMCLCSIPAPEKNIAMMYDLLRPGGTLVVFEHVASDHPLSYFIQSAYTYGGWRYILDGCELNRPTGRYLLQCGTALGGTGWKKTELTNAPGEGWWSIFPHLVGKLVKSDIP